MKFVKSAIIPSLITLIGSASVAFSGTYTVKKGDTLWRISRKHNTTVEAIQQLNQLSNHQIELGQVLTIPEKLKTRKNKTETKQTHQKPTSQKIRAVTHRVTKGETLWGIAHKYNTSVTTLQKRNHLKTNVIEIGQILLIAPPRSKYVPAPSTLPDQPGKISPKELSKELPKEKAENGNSLTQHQEKQPKVDEPQVQPKDKPTVEPKLAPETSPEPDATAQTETETQTETTAETITPEASPEELAEKAKLDAPSTLDTPNPLAPLPPAPMMQDDKPEGLALLSEKQRDTIRQQIMLDRNGMGPGIIDGYPGSFTKTSATLAKHNRPDTFTEKVPLLIVREIPAAIQSYINPDLPGTGKRPDFKQATEDQCLMMYKTPIELLAERYHCSERLLEKINPQIDFNNLSVGTKILVPNVAEFKIEDFMTPEGKAITYKYLRKTRLATRVDVDYVQKRIMVWHNSGTVGAADELLASFPVTTNIKKGPKTQRTIAYFAPAPNYMRKKTGFKLKPGPNSPVGIVWAKLGDGFGIHGTSDGSGNGYNTSSGCIRLSNWDMAIFVKLVPSKTKVNFITKPQQLPKAPTGNIAKRTEK